MSRNYAANNGASAARQKEPQVYLPAATVYHGNYQNTGSAIALRMCPATARQAGYLQVELARQLEAGSRDQKTFHRFDWAKRITFRFSFFEAGEIIGVIRGNAESVRDGAGFVHKGAKFTFTHAVDPKPGYLVKAAASQTDGAESKVEITLTPDEAFAIGLAMSASMGMMAFGC